MLRENLNQSEIISEEGNLEEGNNLLENQSSNSIQKQNQNSKTEQVDYKKSLFLDVAGLLCSSAVGAGVGYLLGGLIRTFVDLSKEGILELQKRSKEENAQRYTGINGYTITGLSFGATVGVLTYLYVSEYIKQKKEREMELQAVRDNVAENNNFNGALSNRQEVRIENGIANYDNQIRLLGADITVNGDTRRDLNQNPRHIMVVGEGDMNTRDVASIFQLPHSREISAEPPNIVEKLHLVEFEKLFDEMRENSRKLQEEQKLKEPRESQLEVANNFLESTGYNNIFANSPNLFFVMRRQDNKQIEEIAPEEDDGRGVRYVANDENMSTRVEAIQSLATPRDGIRGSQAKEVGGIEGIQSGKFVLGLVRAIEEGKINRGNAR
jgi:hypothetical protein